MSGTGCPDCGASIQGHAFPSLDGRKVTCGLCFRWSGKPARWVASLRRNQLRDLGLRVHQERGVEDAEAVADEGAAPAPPPS